MVNAITQLFGKGSEWLSNSRKSSIEIKPLKTCKLPSYDISACRIASVQINKGCVKFNYTQEPTLQILLNHDTSQDNPKDNSADTSDNQHSTKKQLVFAGDQADRALDALGECGFFEEIEIRVKKRLFLNARFDYQDDLSNYQFARASTSQQTSRTH